MDYIVINATLKLLITPCIMILNVISKNNNPFIIIFRNYTTMDHINYILYQRYTTYHTIFAVY